MTGFKSEYMFRHWYRSTMDRKAYDIAFSHIEKKASLPYDVSGLRVEFDSLVHTYRC